MRDDLTGLDALKHPLHTRRSEAQPSLYRCVPTIGFLEFTRKTNYVDKSALFQNCVGESALFSAEEPPRNRRGTRGIVVYLKSGSWSFHGTHKRKQRKSIRWTFSPYRCVPKIGFLEFSWGQTEKTREIKSGGRNRPPGRNRPIVVYLKSGSWSFFFAKQKKQGKSNPVDEIVLSLCT